MATQLFSSDQLITVVLGTRPEAVKMSPVILRLRRDAVATVRVVLTGQHGNLITDVLDTFGIIPDINLNLGTVGQPLETLMSKILVGVGKDLESVRPGMVLVHGDTLTAVAAATAAFLRQVPVGHIEAGLRSHDTWSPFPEEFSRRSISMMASYHFPPTNLAADNLATEGVLSSRMFVTGNTGIDAFNMILNKAVPTHPIFEEVKKQAESGLKVVTVTCHRRESWGVPLERVLDAVKRLHDTPGNDFFFVVPLHPNPVVQDVVRARLAGLENVRCIEPVPYDQFPLLLQVSWCVLTDSGGIQEEAPSVGVPVFVLRDVTERPEAVLQGSAVLVGTDTRRIVAAVETLRGDPDEYERRSVMKNPYGDGHAASRISKCLEGTLGNDCFGPEGTWAL